MTETIEIRVFISCPRDVQKERNIVKEVCRNLSNDFQEKKIIFSAIEWESIVGDFGERAQEVINKSISNYDIYIGIWWMKFGSKTGGINPHTNEEFESGTEEEFTIAYKNWKVNKIPSIYLFQKHPRSPKNSEEAEQLRKILDFFESREEEHLWVHKFKKPLDFQAKIYSILNQRILNLWDTKKVDKKTTALIKKFPSKDTDTVHTDIEKTPDEFITRSFTHSSSLNKSKNSFLWDSEKLNLDEIILEETRIILLGDAGSGKSTELRNLYHVLKKKDSPLRPVFKSLRNYTPEKEIEKFLPTSWNEIPKDILLLILDGLDEIEPQNFNTVIRQINNFSSKHKNARIVISCRTNFYELPVNRNKGTLDDFEPYFINKLTSTDITEYYSKKYGDENSHNFINELYRNKLGDLAGIPFFLMLLSENYANEQKLFSNRAKLYETFLLERFEFDKNKYSNTLSIREKKYEIIQLLEKVALCMEILCKNSIEEKEILEIITSNEFNTLKHCTAFKKQAGGEYIWEFEHNNIQEYLAAKALSKLDFKQIVKFIAFEADYKKLIPSWFNTLSFLFSILDTNSNTFKQLSSWIIENEKELLIKFEPDKVTEKLREEIFQGIFNHYKKHDTWLYSNKFNTYNLAKFGQSKTNIDFLIDELRDEQNTRTVVINAIHLLRDFENINERQKKEVTELLIEHTKRNVDDNGFIFNSVSALSSIGVEDSDAIDYIMSMIKHKKNQHARIAGYRLLSQTDNVDKYADYLIEGYKILNGHIEDVEKERENIVHMSEGMCLGNCISKISSPEIIKRFLKYTLHDVNLETQMGTDDLFKAIINKAITTYEKNKSIYDFIFTWYMKNIEDYAYRKSHLGIDFFEGTNTKHQTFINVWKANIKEHDKDQAVGNLINEESVNYIVDEYIKRNFTNKEINSLRFSMNWNNNENLEKFNTLLTEKTDYQIPKSKSIDYEATRKRKKQEDFNILFDGKKLFKETMKVFDDLKKEVLSRNELYGIKIDNRRKIELDDYYSGITMDILRGFSKEGIANKNEVLQWFKENENGKWYRVQLIHSYLSNDKDEEIKVSNQQKQWLINWCKEEISTVDFRNIQYRNEWNKALRLWYFARKYDIEYSKEILLDMLSFDYWENRKQMGIDYLIGKLDKKDIIERMVENMKNGIQENDFVLKNHVKYLSEHQVKEVYPLIYKEILNPERDNHKRHELLDIFFEGSKDVDSLKTMLQEADSAVKWSIIDKLLSVEEKTYVEEYLLRELKNINSEDKLILAENLVKLNNIEGLKIFSDWIKNELGDTIEEYQLRCFGDLTTIDAIPYLIDLLEFSYTKDIETGSFDNLLDSLILDYLYKIALVSKRHFDEVITSLEKIREENTSLGQKAKHLINRTIESIDSQFYMDLAKSYTIEDAKRKLALIPTATNALLSIEVSNETELEGLVEQEEQLIKKINFFQKELIITADTEKKFELNYKIGKMQEQLVNIRNKQEKSH